MANQHSTLASLFSDIAAAIREKTGETKSLVADDFPSAIASISAAGDGLWIESGVIPSESSDGYLAARIPPQNVGHYSTLVGCCLWFFDERGNIADTHAFIFTTSASQGIGKEAPFSCSSGTVSVDKTSGEIYWVSSDNERAQSTQYVRYIVYGTS